MRHSGTWYNFNSVCFCIILINFKKKRHFSFFRFLRVYEWLIQDNHSLILKKWNPMLYISVMCFSVFFPRFIIIPSLRYVSKVKVVISAGAAPQCQWIEALLVIHSTQVLKNVGTGTQPSLTHFIPLSLSFSFRTPSLF